MANTLRFKRGLLAGLPSAAVGEPLFTTDTFDLYIGTASGTQKYQKFIASGTTSQLLRGDGSLLTMPIVLSSPANGEVLKYNGTNWVNSSDAGITGSGVAGQVAYFTGATTQGGSNNLFWDASNNRLGIGTNAPLNKFELRTSNNVTFNIGNTGSEIDVKVGTNGGTYGIAANYYAGNFNFLTDAGSGTFTQKARITATGNFIINNASTDNGLRFQVTGDGYFSGSVGIGTSSLSAVSLRVAKNITGAVGVNGIVNDGQIQTDVTNSVNYFYTIANTAASLTMTNLRHYLAVQGTFGAGTAITNQIGFYANSSMIGATNNYGFYGDLASGTGRWNLYLVGTAANHINGNLQLGSATAFASAEKFQLTGDARIKTTGTGGLILEATSGTETPNLTFLSTTNRYNLDNSSGTLRFFRENTDGTSGAVRMSLTDDGNLGLGVVPSAWESTVRAFQFGNSGTIYNNTSDYRAVIGSNVFNNSAGTATYLVTAAATQYMQISGTHRWFYAASGTAGNAITFTQAMTLDASGNLGLGITTPNLSGSARVLTINTTNATDYPTLELASAGSLGFYINGNNSENIISTQGSRPLRFFANGAETMRILSTRRVHIGTFSSDTGELLQVNGTMRVSGASTLTGNVTIGANGTSPIIDILGHNSAVTRIQNNAGFSASFNGLEFVSNRSNSNSLPAWAMDLGGHNSAISGSDKFAIARKASGGSYVNFLYFDTSNSYYDNTQHIFRNSGGTTTFLTIASTGAATFSSSVTATSFNLGNGQFLRLTRNSGGLQYDAFGIVAGTDNTRLISTGDFDVVDGALSSMFKIASTGAATFSSSVTLSGNLTVDTNTFFVDSSANRVGVGTASPLYALHVTGDGYFGDNVRFPNLKGCVFVQTGGTLLGSIAMDSANAVTIDNNGFAGLSVGGSYTMTGGNLGIGHSAFGTSATKTISVNSGTAPSTSPADAFQLYSADITAGNAAPHFRTENGGIIKLYQQTTGVTSATYIGGAGTTVTDLDTFDGYTIPQIVKALRNAGLLA